MANVKVHFILDKSGSMDPIKESTISAFNEYIQTLKADKENKYKMTLTLFDQTIVQFMASKRNKKQLMLDLDLIQLSERNYTPGGMTALYDAVCTTLHTMKEQKGKNLVVVMTDGEENSSKEYTELEFKAMIKDLEEKKNWTFLYLGANQDSWRVAQKYGFKVDNVANFNATNVGVRGAMAATARATAMFAFSSVNDSNLLAQSKDSNGFIKNN